MAHVHMQSNIDDVCVQTPHLLFIRSSDITYLTLTMWMEVQQSSEQAARSPSKLSGNADNNDEVSAANITTADVYLMGIVPPPQQQQVMQCSSVPTSNATAPAPIQQRQQQVSV